MCLLKFLFKDKVMVHHSDGTNVSSAALSLGYLQKHRKQNPELMKTSFYLLVSWGLTAVLQGNFTEELKLGMQQNRLL